MWRCWGSRGWWSKRSSVYMWPPWRRRTIFAHRLLIPKLDKLCAASLLSPKTQRIKSWNRELPLTLQWWRKSSESPRSTIALDGRHGQTWWQRATIPGTLCRRTLQRLSTASLLPSAWRTVFEWCMIYSSYLKAIEKKFNCVILKDSQRNK